MPTDNSPAVLFAPRASDGKRLVDVMPELVPHRDLEDCDCDGDDIPCRLFWSNAFKNFAWVDAKHTDHNTFRRWIHESDADALFRVASERVLRKWHVNKSASAPPHLVGAVRIALLYSADWPTLAALLWRVAEVGT